MSRFGSDKRLSSWAALCPGNKILVIVFHLLKDGTFYDEELHDRPNPIREERWHRQVISKLEQAGYKVTRQEQNAAA
jgi:hypothetical protein